jgi:hypothetical protein
MNAFGVTKLAVNLVSGLGVVKIVDNVVKNNVAIVTTWDAIRVNAGVLALGTVVLDHTAQHLNDRMDELAAWQAKRKEELEKKRKETSKP